MLLFLISTLLPLANSEIFSLSDHWATKRVNGYRLFPSHDSNLYPHFVAVASDGFALVHRTKSDVEELKRNFTLHSICSYDYVGEEYYVINVDKIGAKSVVALNVSYDELNDIMTSMTEIRANPSYVSFNPKHETFNAVWQESVPNLRHFEVKSIPVTDAMEIDKEMGLIGYFPSQWEIFTHLGEQKVFAIYRKGYGVRYRIQIGTMFQKMLDEMRDSDLKLHAVSSNMFRSRNRRARQYWLIWLGKDFTWNNIEIPQTSKRKWDDVDVIVKERMREHEMPSISLCVLYEGKSLYSASYGYSDIRKKEEAQPEHEYRVASISKMITAMATAQLVNQKRVSLDRYVFGKFGVLNELDVHYSLLSIRIRHLLEHSSGAWSHVNKLEFFRQENTTSELISNVTKDYLLKYRPGYRFLYSNIGYVVLGQVIEKVSGEPYETFVQKHILQPLGIEGRIGSREPGSNEVHYYSPDNANPYNHWNPQLLAAAAGWIFSPCDLARFLAHLETHKNTAYRLITQQSTTNAYYGRGVQLANPGLYHFGSLAGSEAIGYTDKTQVVILTNIRGKEHNVHTAWMLDFARRITKGVNKDFNTYLAFSME